MSAKAIRIAFYGKGGIGKSTISCNVSATLAGMGKKVLHIGCDPKMDSTRLLTDKKIPDTLTQMTKFGDDIDIDDIIYPGRIENLYCIEAGGPKAGTGCAGAGITAMYELLKELGVFHMDWDVIVYDVLGDVVCGGFSIPMKSAYVDKVFVVSSSEYMAIYAANNILNAVNAYSYGKNNLFEGLIWNHCVDEWDDRIANGFAKLTNTSILSRVEEMREILHCDYKKQLFTQAAPDSRAALAIKGIADRILAIYSDDYTESPRCNPQSTEDLENWREDVINRRYTDE